MATQTQSQWVREKTSRLPNEVGALVLERHAELIGQPGTSPLAVANQWLSAEARELRAARITQAFDEQAIRDHAENYARLCARMHSLESRQSFALSMGVEPPAGKSVTPTGAVARLDDPLWWRRQLRKRWTRAAENALRDLGVIRKGRAPYASDEAVRHRAAQKRRMRSYLEGHIAVNEVGEQLSLLSCAEKSTANPAIRRMEFMTRVSGFEEIARDLGHVAEFVTLTAPSHFHAYLAAAGRNPLFQRAVVREAQQWLCRMWARARAKLKRLSVLVYGFRIAEPHHDATPHWHLLLFVRARDADTVRTLLREVWLGEFSDEVGSRAHRTKFEAIDSAKGSAVGYVAKYVSKNIDGEGAIGNDNDRETGAAIHPGIARVDAWASIHGIRQFQQIGGPPVGLWREARRLRDRAADPDIERARDSADRGDWRGFTRNVGGIAAGRRTNLRLERCETGARNRYGEARPAPVIGLRWASAVELTRPHRWRIERCVNTGIGGATSPGGCAVPAEPRGSYRRQSLTSSSNSSGDSPEKRSAKSATLDSRSESSLGPVAITVRGAPNYNEPTSWTNPNETSQAGPE